MNVNDLITMLDQMLDMDLAATPNMAATVAIRDRLIDHDYDKEFANDVVSGMEIDVSLATVEEAERLGQKYGDVLEKMIETMYNQGFGQKHIVAMASRMIARLGVTQLADKLREANDEIERLTAENDLLRKVVDRIAHDRLGLRYPAEIARDALAKLQEKGDE